MKHSIGFYQFEQAFNSIRPNNFSYSGLKALFDYLEDLEQDTGEELELDVISLCCDFTEYNDVHEFVADYGNSYIVWDVEPEAGDDENESVEGVVDYVATLDNIRDYTIVIDIDGEAFIAGAF